MKELEKRKWYHYSNRNEYDTFSVIYDDGLLMIVRNDETGKYSFGGVQDFGTLLGFGSGKSCIEKSDILRILNGYIEIDTEYIESLGQYATKNINRWERMIAAVNAAD